MDLHFDPSTLVQPVQIPAMSRQQFARAGPTDGDSAITLDRDYIRAQTRWIRDDLDPLIAREGPEVLSPDSVITLFTFFEQLRHATISYETLRCSRVCSALLAISSSATRWPSKLIDKVDDIIEYWEAIHGPLQDIRPLLYEQGGRLHGIATPEDLERDKLLIKWLRMPATPVAPSISRRRGDLGFRPGDWWINPMFAHRAGIIDSGSPTGGITCDSHDAYALLMTYNDEIASSTPDSFIYRSKPSDRGRYRLTAATAESRHPIRVLRSHTLPSFWTPKAGVRYEGLFTVTGWNITYDQKERQWNYDISFTRIVGDQVSMKEVLRRPTAEEVDDYVEYKNIRRDARLNRNPLVRARPLVKPPDAVLPLHARRSSQTYSQQLQHHHHYRDHRQQQYGQTQNAGHQISPKKTSNTNTLFTKMMIGIPPLILPVSKPPIQTPVDSSTPRTPGGRVVSSSPGGGTLLPASGGRSLPSSPGGGTLFPTPSTMSSQTSYSPKTKPIIYDKSTDP